MSRTIKKLLVIVFDLTSIILSAVVSVGFLYPFILFSPLSLIIPISLTCIMYLFLGQFFKIFSKINHCTGMTEVLMLIASATGAFSLSNIIMMNIVQDPLLSLRFYFLTYLFSIIAIVGSRMITRIYFEYIFRKRKEPVIGDQIRTLVVGAGNGGSIFVKSLKNFPNKINLIGIVDDDVRKDKSLLFGVPILGKIKDIPKIVAEKKIEQITIAIPSLPAETYEYIIDLCNKTSATVNKMPYIEDVLQGDLSPHRFREVNVVDLLGREEVNINSKMISSELIGKTVLVSGAGGSIGSEICRQILKFSPKKIILLGHGENSIYQIHRELKGVYKDSIEIIPVIADVQDPERIKEVMMEFRPDHVYHAAAHKHVPMMEYNPYEAVKNNIFGTKNMAEAAKDSSVESFVMISTDKAVNPPNVMGSTKRIAEMIVTGLNEPGKTRFAAVRFGNVLGSRGSVVPLFQEQIKNGGPLTVTDFRMTRYFMTIPEASRLVIQAGSLAKGGEIFVLDMGEPVKIVDLAKKVIKLSGYTVKEIPIVETGIRPGEKLYEELLVDEEKTGKKVHDKIFVGRAINKPLYTLMTKIESWNNLSPSELREAVITLANDNEVLVGDAKSIKDYEEKELKALDFQGEYVNA